MLKGFVSGEEKDIKRIPMKGKNLFNIDGKSTENGYMDTTQLMSDGMTRYWANGEVSEYITVSSNTQYTLTNMGSYNAPAYCFYTENKEYISGLGFNGRSVITFTTPSNCKYVRFTHVKTQPKTMLNLGSTPLPYEPYGYQEGWEVRDNQDKLIWGREDEIQTATGTLPFKGYSLPVKVKSLLGNTVQNGTPAPDNIIMPEMCGVKTGNIISEIISDKAINESGTVYTNTNFIIISASVSQNEDYTFSLDSGLSDTTCRIHAYNGDTWIVQLKASNISSAPFTVTTPSGTTKLMISVTNGAASKRPMIVFGSTAPTSYIPYGFQIPLTNAGQTVPIYLGEVPTVRRVKKLVLDGTEKNWNWLVSAGFAYTTQPSVDFRNTTNGIVCTHFPVVLRSDIAENTICWGAGSIGDICIKTVATSLTDFKAYLASEYAAGHPVTVWYVLAEPTTEISNEPLCKISTYADELTTIQVHGLSAPLYGIGDYKDTLNLATGVVTRKVKKLVLTGEENIEIKSGNAKWYIPIADMKTPASVVAIEWCCSHYQTLANNVSWTSYDYMISWSTGDTGSSIGLRIRDIDFLTATTPADFKAYLAAQYQAGTPVTIWYVLSTPETETVTVPTGMTGEIEGYLTQVSTPTPTKRSVPKWNGEEESGGTYAVTVYTPPEIPTITGQNTLTVDTDLAPSSLIVKGHIKELT